MKSATIVCLLLLALPAVASDSGSKYFAGLTLVDQDGRQVALYDLMKDRTIIINTFFSSCTGSCPVMAHSLAAVQEKYADRVGKDLVLVSITVEPVTDTPRRLKDYATRVGAKSGWYFLTGSTEQVEAALRKLGQYVDTPAAHLNVILVGNDKTGLWKKLFGRAKSEEIVASVGSVLDDSGK